MAGKADQGGAAGTTAAWLGEVFASLRAATDQAIAVVTAAEPPADVAEAEKRARAIGVLARTAKAVAALEAELIRKSRSPEEDGMSDDDRDLSDAELAGLQAEFFARVDHLVAAIERKSLAAGLDREPAARAAGASAAGGREGDAEAERRPAPPEDWRTWVLLGGRGSGKTFAGGFWLNELARGADMTFALVGTALHDVREVMVEGLKAQATADNRPRWEAGRRRLVWPSGAAAYAFSAEDPDSLRGPQFHAAWADEFCAWRNIEATLSNLRFGLRLGADPKLAITTTPRPIPALRRLLAEPGVVKARLATKDNADNLAPGFLGHLQSLYAGTRLEAQEMEGLVVEADGALFRAEDLARARGSRPARFERVVMAVDPPASAHGDACGIVVAGRWDKAGYVLADRSARGLSPAGWARRVAETAREFDADLVLAEANQGGEMVRTLLGQADCPAQVKLVHASRSKKARAEPVAALYEQGRVVHCGAFPALEEEMMALGGEAPGGKSPDRADALVWGLTHLLLAGKSQPRLRAL